MKRDHAEERLGMVWWCENDRRYERKPPHRCQAGGKLPTSLENVSRTTQQ